MAVQTHHDDVATCKVVYTGSSLATLGYSRNGVDVETQEYNNPIHSDRFGGDRGPPSDFQLLGFLIRVTINLAEYDETVYQGLKAFAKDATEGTFVSPGTFLVQDSKYFRCLIHSVNRPINMPIARLERWNENKGTLHKQPTAVFLGIPDASYKVYDSSTS